ncbi:MAG: response regulator [Planctomycetota bacterium]|nr:MAG: response regulator [Planctomycetota bacterium]
MSLKLQPSRAIPCRRKAATILVVDDDDLVRRFTQTVLKRAGYQVLPAEDGREALQISKQFREGIHLVLCDVVMPGDLAGPRLVEDLMLMRPDLGVVFISGFHESPVLRRALLRPRTGFLAKPFGGQQLLQKVESALGRFDAVG